jgi:uncharacterized protein YndB with AHSA1/START domain
VKPFEISRVYDAPREKVWQAWTEPARLKHWWGPRGFTVHTCKVDLRPGGIFLYGMKAPDGAAMWGITRHPSSPGWPQYILSTVEFSALNGKTKVSISWIPHEASEAERRTFEEGRPSMQQGWGGTLDQLETYLKS